jgi:hypothetical protein
VSKNRASRRRFRVIARPQQRARRAQLTGAFAAVLLLGAVAAIAARQTLASMRMRASAPAAPGRVVVDGPENFRALAQTVVDATPGAPGDKAAALKARFACVSDVTVSRGWGDAASTLTPVLRRAVAPALVGGHAGGALGEDGTVFAAPDGVYALSGPFVDPAGADANSLRDFARAWPTLNAAGALPSPLSAAQYKGPVDGWQLRLEDGTIVQWGPLTWTQEKIARLKEALADARSREPGAFAADLRFFDDGKVLLKPLTASAGASALAAARGRLR